MSPRGSAGERGLTLMELTFLVLLLSLASYVFTHFILGTREAVSRQEAAQAMLQSQVRIDANLNAGLNTCVELLADYDDSTGAALQGLRDLVNTSAADGSAPFTGGQAPPTPVSFSLWPVVLSESQVDLNGPKDPGAVEWGDELAYVCALDPVTFTAYYTPPATTGGAWTYSSTPVYANTDAAEVLSVARYQFVYDYLSYYPGSIINGCGHGLRLTEWRSLPYIAYSSLSSLTDSPQTYAAETTTACCPRLTAACTYLSAAGYTYAFNPQAATETSSCSGCFYQLTAAKISGGVSATEPTNLQTGSWAYLDDFDMLIANAAQPGKNLGRVSRSDGGATGVSAGPSGYSVAFNTAGAMSQTSVLGLQGAGASVTVPAYAETNNNGSGQPGPPTTNPSPTGFPAGFEVGIDGSSGSREVFIRLVLMASNAGSTKAGYFQALSGSSETSFAPAFDF